ncbi:hypothetical protein LAG90_17195 [Marinilongibacter aquaticus]|uniref:ComEC/Rec2 family competence protein n=1 Tax=Marinilongibacter aquaticus TaxID=2975157 RepID=UPI0021BD181F|nr:hypothetical protein [Marinilongibacter aquaticus]UBM58541.1 hypothetical protein LAG90_17195 [Marinilongibacter aquaticus]
MKNPVGMHKILLAVLFSFSFPLLAQKVGDTYPKWQEGNLEIHQISTGRGNAAFILLPDGTTLLIDAGALDPTSPRVQSPRNTAAKPNDSRQPGEWIARYVRNFMERSGLSPQLDYAQLTHFHDDHMGALSSVSPKASEGNYFLTGITELAAYLPIGKIIDRAYPNYDYPVVQNSPMMENYKQFVKWQSGHKGLRFEQSKAGSKDQLVLKYKPETFQDTFEIRNIVANGKLWTGFGSNTKNLFPDLGDLDKSLYPSENMCSIGIRISYGAFDYFSGGDMPGNLRFGRPAWQDLETPVSQVVGPVEAMILDHHGNRDAINANLLANLRPQVFVIPTWSSDHPGHNVIDRIYDQNIYSGNRDVFATDMLEANKLVIGNLLDRLKSDSGHVVIRVMPGGQKFWVYILDDRDEKMTIKAIHGPYDCH